MTPMDAERTGRILEGAIRMWGRELQMIVAVEELSELQKALCKRLRAEDADVGTRARMEDSICEEIADCYIMLQQMELLFDADGAVADWEVRKLERLEKRVFGDWIRDN